MSGPTLKPDAADRLRRWTVARLAIANANARAAAVLAQLKVAERQGQGRS
jgi:hypothetical protein